MKDVIIVGGGLAGLFNAIQLSKERIDVLLIEKSSYPFHRVCGEYISNEVVPFMQELDLDLSPFNPPQLTRFELSAVSGKKVGMPLDLGGFGISRYTLDHFLFEKAKEAGALFRLNTTVTDVSFEGSHFLVTLNSGEVLKSKVVIGAYGKRSRLDKTLSRPFMSRRSPYLAVKYHIKFDIADDLIALHNFEGGYCGISKVENDIVNLCYLSQRHQLKTAGDIKSLEQNVLSKNKHLANIFNTAEFIFDKPLVINEISFAKKSAVENHMLMCGDAAGLITPLCGNGMAIAIHASKLSASLILSFLNKEIKRIEMEKQYKYLWKNNFQNRLWVGRKSQSLFGTAITSEISVLLMKNIKPLARLIMQNTHGQPF